MCPKFDKMAKMAVTAIANLMGETAIWLSSTHDTIPGHVLFKDPTEPVQIGDAEGYEYRPNNATAEYYEGVFPGLKQAVDSGASEYLKIRDKMYLVVSINTKFDGKIYVAQLEPHTADYEDGNE